MYLICFLSSSHTSWRLVSCRVNATKSISPAYTSLNSSARTKYWGGGFKITEPGRNIGGGGGGSMISEPLKNIGGLRDVIRAPQKYRGAPWCYLSPTNIWGGGAQRYLSLTKIWGGGVLNDIRVPPNIWGFQWYPRSTKYIFWVNDNIMRDPMSEPPSSPPQINIYKMFIFEW